MKHPDTQRYRAGRPAVIATLTGGSTNRFGISAFRWLVLALLALLALVVTACGGGGGGGSPTTGNVIVEVDATRLVNSGLDVGELEGRVACPGGASVLLVITGVNAAGQCSDLAPALAAFAVRFTYDLNGTVIELATAEKSLTVVAGETLTLQFTDADLVLSDDDSDGVSNLDEILFTLDPGGSNAFLSGLDLACVDGTLPSCANLTLIVPVGQPSPPPGFVGAAAVGGLTDYTSIQGAPVEAITVAASAVIAGATITVNGQAVISGAASAAIPLTTGVTEVVIDGNTVEVGVNEIVIVVTAVDGVTQAVYRIFVTRRLSDNADLSALSLSDGSLSPAFQADTTAYTATVGFTIANVTLTATTAESAATLEIAGLPGVSGVESAPIALPVIGVNPLAVIVTAADGVTQRTYTVTVTRLGTPNLATLSLVGLTEDVPPEQVEMTLDPVFAADSVVNDYGAQVINAVASVVITATAEAPGAVIAIAGGGLPYNPGDPIPLPNIGTGNVNTITIVVTHASSGAVDPLTRTYTLSVIRQEPSVYAAEAYLKPFNAGQGFESGAAIALSADGTTAVVGAPGEQNGSGAVYVYVRDNGIWSEQAPLLKAANSATGAGFGHSVALSANGNLLAVGAPGGRTHGEDFPAEGGAVHVFTRDGQGVWAEQAELRAFNPGEEFHFGFSVALSVDGATLAIGAPRESSNVGGVHNAPVVSDDHDDTDAVASGAVYVYAFNGVAWQLQAFVKAPDPKDSITELGSVEERFGWDVALSANGNRLAVGTPGESSNAAGVNGVISEINRRGSGAVYLYERQAATWQGPSDHIKAQVPHVESTFGSSVALSADGDTLAIGEPLQSSGAQGVWDTTVGIPPEQNVTGPAGARSGAAYIFRRGEDELWFQQVFIKASNSRQDLLFGTSLDLSADDKVLVVGAPGENSAATAIDGNQLDTTSLGNGAAYAFFFEEEQWSQVVYIKASNSRPFIRFGSSVALSGTGDVLGSGATGEGSVATGVDLELPYPVDNAALNRGAAYVYRADQVPADAGPP